MPFYDTFHDTVIEFVLSMNTKPSKWLDIGCGTGTLAVKAARTFKNTDFTLLDVSEEMIAIAKEKLRPNDNIRFIAGRSENADLTDGAFDVITAILSNHYFSREARSAVIKKCFDMLEPNGVFITFENIAPFSEKGTEIGLKRWERYQTDHGRQPEEVKQHISRFGKGYSPITVTDHLELLNAAGFRCAEMLWASYMQAGFYAVK